MSQGSSRFAQNQDVVGVYSGFDQVFRDARPMSASVKEEAKLMEHPTERGVVITDHMVVQPVEIELVMTLTPETYRDTYKEIKSLFLAGEMLKVQTKADMYSNQLIAAMPHDEIPDVFDTFDLTLKLKEVKVIQAEFEAVFKASNPKQSPTAERGEVQPQPEEESKGSWLAQNTSLGK